MIHIEKNKISQEKISRVFYPFFKFYYFIINYIYRELHIEGCIFGLRRAIWRARVASLGAYSDISPGVVVKTPKNLYIGLRTCIGAGSFVDAGGGVKIGDYVMISHMVSINSQTHPITPPYHGLLQAPTVIRDHVWIGAGVIIMVGVEIGEGAIIGAGSVVTRSVDPWTIVVGTPAKVLRQVKRK